ncbi:sensor histidine kinase [Nannocystis punicea]|uniref:histidine kinase n=1 Tax=Nannocystis punicea TaxID=2995304 RepID=A0ABY7GX27_9BACT|nr:HAMP domain-containing sensor histidine kinase [Nannocystis poenicansa]WAS91544.1 HAMP domain-containing sensor histidine kinase [Nannocystis poenicansa]
MIRSSLRRRTYAVVFAVVLAPLAVVAIGARIGAGEMERMQAGVDLAARAVADGLADADAAARAELVARVAGDAGVRVLVIDREGEVVASADHEDETSLGDRLDDVFFGPEGAPNLRAADEERPAPGSWPEVLRAAKFGRSSGCAVVLSGTLLRCHASVRDDRAFVVLAEKSSPRAIRALSHLRYPLLKLTLYVLILGALLATWLGSRIVTPILRLRREVLARVADPLRAQPIPRVARSEVGDLGESFNTLLAALAARSRANEQFAADLAHELKSPIAAVRACAEALQRPADEARAHRLARLLIGSSDRLDALVTRFLAIARAEAGLPHEPRAAFDVAALVRGICDALAGEERYAAVRFETELAGVEVVGVAGALETALRNVLDNAASFAGDGGLVRARVTSDEASVLVEIADSGPGICADNLPRVFDRFFTDRPTGGGTGLGLAYTKAAVEAHGGTITVASVPGRGATFTIRLPRASPPPPKNLAEASRST